VNDRMIERLAELRQELVLGEQRLRELERERTDVQQTVLRIAGAVQVLEELLADDGDANGATPADGGGTAG
jgi:hypothetical protein